MGSLTQSVISGSTQKKSKIPEYAKDFKKEWLYIRGINKEFVYLINKLDLLNHGLFETTLANSIKNIMKDFLRAQEKGKLKNISNFILPSDITCNLNSISKNFELYKLRYDAFCDDDDDDDFVYDDDDDDDENDEYLVDGKPYPGFIEFYDIFKKFYNQIKNEDSDSDYEDDDIILLDSDSDYEDDDIILLDSDSDEDDDDDIILLDSDSDDDF